MGSGNDWAGGVVKTWWPLKSKIRDQPCSNRLYAADLKGCRGISGKKKKKKKKVNDTFEKCFNWFVRDSPVLAGMQALLTSYS